MIDTAGRTQQRITWKQTVVDRFLSGQHAGDIANYYGVSRLRVEQAIREAISGLAARVVHQSEAQNA